MIEPNTQLSSQMELEVRFRNYVDDKEIGRAHV